MVGALLSLSAITLLVLVGIWAVGRLLFGK
jgi:flagellar biogenesis protein FliO